MRKMYFVFGAVASMALASGMVACSGDDDDNTVTPGTDSGTADTSTTPDTGIADTGTKPDTGTVACATCSEILAKGLSSAGTPCDTALPLVLKLVDCTCNKDPLTMKATDGGYCDNDSGMGECGDLCTDPTHTVPSSACQGCAADQCTAELAACAADGTDGGIPTNPDAGDGGDGG